MVDFAKLLQKEKERQLDETKTKIVACLTQPRSYYDILTILFGEKKYDMKYKAMVAEALCELEDEKVIISDQVTFKTGEDRPLSLIAIFWKAPTKKTTETISEGDLALICRE